jgi:hypothetical protein
MCVGSALERTGKKLRAHADLRGESSFELAQSAAAATPSYSLPAAMRSTRNRSTVATRCSKVRQIFKAHLQINDAGAGEPSASSHLRFVSGQAYDFDHHLTPSVCGRLEGKA